MLAYILIYTHTPINYPHLFSVVDLLKNLQFMTSHWHDCVSRPKMRFCQQKIKETVLVPFILWSYDQSKCLSIPIFAIIINIKALALSLATHQVDFMFVEPNFCVCASFFTFAFSFTCFLFD